MDARIFAVVVTRDRPMELRIVAEALLAQTIRLDAILVIDNQGSIPASVTLAGFPVEIVRCPANIGGAGGFRLGLERAVAAGARWAWLMDDDAVPEPGALAALLGGLAHLPPDTGAVCGTVVEHGRLARQHRRYFDFFIGVERLVPERFYRQSLVEIDTASFVGLLVSATAAASAGLPEAGFFLSYDDTEYSLRLKRAGWRIFLVPGSRVAHLRPAGARMRVNRFGQRHYFNIRNRIAVQRRFCRFPGIAACGGAGLGMLIWLFSRAPFSRRAFGIFCRALVDGWRGRLGPFPGGD
ncbi:glycosyltransferase [Methylomagnum sp.]